MGMFKIGSSEKKFQGDAVEGNTGRFKRNASATKSGLTYFSKSLPPPENEAAPTDNNDSDTEPANTDSDVSHKTPKRTGSSRTSSKNRSSVFGDSDTTPRSDADKVEAITENKDGTKSSSHSRKSRRHKKRSTQEPPTPPKSQPSPSSSSPHMTSPYEYYARQAINPFANKGEVYLCHDMATVADAMKLDLNTQVMLAYYDAKSLEDFCLMAESDLRDLVTRAQAMRRTIPPLQIRKIQVLREWVHEISTPQDDTRLPAWIRLSQKKTKRKSKRLIPEDWNAQFSRDLPRLKHKLRKKGENLSAFPFCSFVPTFQSISMCGLVT